MDTLLGAAQLAALPLELVHADRGQGRRGVVAGGVMVDLVDRHRGVDDFGLDHLLLDHRLDGLVDMTDGSTSVSFFTKPSVLTRRHSHRGGLTDGNARP